MNIYAPVQSANGIYASVMFVNGVGETTDPALIEWFRNHGYKTESDLIDFLNDPPSTYEISENDSVEETEPDFYTMTPNDLREWMKDHGYGGQIRNIKNKEKLLEILRG